MRERERERDGERERDLMYRIKQVSDFLLFKKGKKKKNIIV